MKLSSWIRRDGLLHIETCALIVIALKPFMPLWFAAAIAAAAGILFELWEKKHGGVASWHDVICDMGGVILGTGIILLSYI